MFSLSMASFEKSPSTLFQSVDVDIRINAVPIPGADRVAPGQTSTLYRVPRCGVIRPLPRMTPYATLCINGTEFEPLPLPTDVSLAVKKIAPAYAKYLKEQAEFAEQMGEMANSKDAYRSLSYETYLDRTDATKRMEAALRFNGKYSV